MPFMFVGALWSASENEGSFAIIAWLALAAFMTVMLPVISLIGAKAEYYRMLISKEQ
jgi:hypothetical protein